MSSITQKVLIDLETSKATEEMKKLAKAGGNTADTIKALNARAKELETSLGQIKAAAPTSTFTAFKGAMKGVGDVMTPFNQGLEVGKKLLGVAEEGLAAYAKTSRSAARDVRALTGEFEYYKKTILEGVGAATVELGKSAVNFDQAVEALRRGGEKGFGKAYGEITTQWNALNDTVIDSGKAFGSLAKSLGETFGVITDKVAKNATAAMEASVARARQLAEEYKKIGRALLGNETPAQRAIRQGAAERAANAARDEAYSEWLDSQEGTRFKIDPGMLAMSDSLGKQITDLEQNTRGSRYAESAGRRNQNFLENAFGPIDDFNAYATAFGTLNTAVQSAMSAWISGSMSLGAAIKKGIGDALAGLASQMAVEALKHGAYALGSLAFGDVRGAGQHAIAAAEFGAASIAAAVAAKKLGSGASAGAPASSGGGSYAGGASGGGGGGGAGTGQTVNHYTIVYGETFYSESLRMQQLDADRMVKRAVGNSYVDHN